MTKYRVKTEGFILGSHFEKGAPIELDPDQAKYLLPPMSDTLELEVSKKTVAKPAPQKETGKVQD